MLTSLIILISSFSLCSQNAIKKSSRIQVQYLNDYNKNENIIANIKIREDRFVPLKDVDIQFYNISDTTKILLSTVTSDFNGTAILIIDDNLEIFKDSSGIMTFEVEYEGNDSIKGSTKEIEVKHANLELSFNQKDSLKYITVGAYEISTDQKNIPIEEQEIQFYIKGTFSLLNIGLEETDEDGQVTIEFPIDMPGDTTGVVTIISKIEDSDLYGNIETQGKINWAIPVLLPAEKHRGLGDTDAPLWMVYTLIILLSLVWFHYLYVLYLILKIKLLKTRPLMPTNL